MPETTGRPVEADDDWLHPISIGELFALYGDTAARRKDRTEATAAGGPIPLRTAPCLRCGKRHDSWKALAGCRWRRTVWIQGNGPWASVSDCPRGTTVMLHATQAAAETARSQIDETACSGQCCGPAWHYVACLDDRGMYA
jgi:hypothetical protein